MKLVGVVSNTANLWGCCLTADAERIFFVVRSLLHFYVNKISDV